MSLLLIAVVILLALGAIFQPWNSIATGLPPGPRQLGILGTPASVYKLSSNPRKLLKLLTATYGDVATIWLGRTPIIIISSPQAADDLLEKEAAATSSRPVHKDFRREAMPSRIVLEPSGPEWAKLRRLYNKFLARPHDEKFRKIQDDESRALLFSLLEIPGAFSFECDRFAINVLFRAMYNSRLGKGQDLVISATYKMWEIVYKYFLPGSTFLDYVPLLATIPRWIQPMSLLVKALENRETALHHEYLLTIRHMTQGLDNENPNIGAALYKMPASDVPDDKFRTIFLAMALGAASDTVSAVLQQLFKVIALHPSALHEAQTELDRVVGNTRLPCWADQSNLPYVTAFIDELHRWAPIAVAGLPHATTRDITYRDFFIPKGSILIPNIPALSTSPELYENPQLFNPSRFLPVQRDRDGLTETEVWSGRRHFQFGFGRRACPGVHVANASVFIAVARILWGFNIYKLTNHDLDMDSQRLGLVKKPLAFQVGITCRDAEHRKVIEEWEGA